ncbi:GNAT family N-acetyltransferase [Psychrobacillus sp. OK032]|uniref:GNAT family N-acetyltransferase n=1 Tax=Psychrobacillus sp. OK032 TaxID=1884358 RepID=UPI0008C00F5A|nr:GNAT family protein [Psychrobacillus sp. OK032]SER70998.1 Protein N-acetyltransferase, RimJ/RimL family [Psychrobacillus sp. OK032]
MIVGKRVQLIALDEDSFDLTLKWINDPSIRMFTGAKFPVTKIEHETWFKSKALDKYNKTFAIQSIETKQIIGLVGNNDYDPLNRTTYPFIYIGEKVNQGKGIGQEAFSLIINFCFEVLNVHRIYGYLFEYNTASRNMLEKCGYILEGVLKEHWYKDGKYHNVLVMGRVKDSGE